MTHNPSFEDQQSSFHFEPLQDPSSQIRILSIEPADSPYCIVECRLEVQDLSTSGYKAYWTGRASVQDDTGTLHVVPHWNKPGNQIDQSFIVCNGDLRAVSKSTYTHLCHLRNQGRQPIWLESVCVNVEDPEEYQQQRALQPEIHSTAIGNWLRIDKYEYAPLAGENHIRLLEFELAQGSEEAPQVCFHEISLDSVLEKNHYIHVRIHEILAKHWSMSALILCNGQHLRVPSPLYNAMRQFGARGYRRLWSEAVCVDGENKDEIKRHAHLADLIIKNAAETVSIKPTLYMYSSLTSLPIGIRLLRILPATSDSTEEALIVEINHFPLEETPEFVALSYTWGSSELKGLMFTSDGNILRVTQDLLNALHFLRKHGYNTVWADSICINQEDNAERSQQVLHMGEIYRRAKRVVIDLGFVRSSKEQKKWRILLPALVNILALTSRVLKAVRPEHPQLTPFEYNQFGLPRQKHLAWEEWRIMRTRPWFTRSWVVQEAVAGPSSKVDVMYNWQVYHWKDLIDATQACKFELLGEQSRIGRFAVANMGNFQSSEKSQPHYTLLDLASIFRSMASTDPRDKLYAFRGLASDREYTPLPDYAKSAEDVYNEFATYCISQGQGMQLLCEAGIWRSTRILPNLPSWVVDWSYREPTYVMNFNKHQEAPPILPLDQVPATCRYSASEVRFSQQPKVLCVTGAFIDKILFLSSAVNVQLDAENSDSVEVLNHVLDEAKMFVKECSKVQERYSDRLDTILFVATYGKLSFDVALMKGSRGPYLHHFNPVKLSEKYGFGRKGFDDMMSDYLADQPHKCEMGNRRLCVTEEGYIGLVPGVTEKDDLVAIFKGAKAPFVLRKTAQNPQALYILIGDAKIERTMENKELPEVDLNFGEILIE